MSIEEIYDILTEGTTSQIEKLSGSGVSFSFGPSSGGFSVWNSKKTDGIRSHGLFEVPNCVKLYGNEHTF